MPRMILTTDDTDGADRKSAANSHAQSSSLSSVPSAPSVVSSSAPSAWSSSTPTNLLTFTEMPRMILTTDDTDGADRKSAANSHAQSSSLLSVPSALSVVSSSAPSRVLP